MRSIALALLFLSACNPSGSTAQPSVTATTTASAKPAAPTATSTATATATPPTAPTTKSPQLGWRKTFTFDWAADLKKFHGGTTSYAIVVDTRDLAHIPVKLEGSKTMDQLTATGIEDVTKNQIVVAFEGCFEGDTNCSNFKFQKGDVLFHLQGATGKVTLVLEKMAVPDGQKTLELRK